MPSSPCHSARRTSAIGMPRMASGQEEVVEARQPGPGSNLPENKPPPGPGSYLKLHSWPEKGYMGTAKGFNHYGR